MGVSNIPEEDREVEDWGSEMDGEPSLLEIEVTEE